MVLAAVAAVVVRASRRQDGYVASPDGGARPDGRARRGGRARCATLEDAVAARDADGGGRAGADGSAAAPTCSRAVVANAEALDVAEFTLRYVDETGSAVRPTAAGRPPST